MTETSNIRTMYEVSWHYDNDIFSHCSITPITITATDGENITARDAEGYAFRGVISDYYESEAQAKAAILKDLTNELNACAELVHKEEAQIEAIQRYLEKLK